MSFGCEWDSERRATLTASGVSGEGRISGIRPQTAMDFAIMLARNARAYGVPWPMALDDDPYGKAIIDGLGVQLGQPQPKPQESAPAADLDEILRAVDLLRSSLLAAQDLANEIRYAAGG